MFQTFETTSRPEFGAERLARLRAVLGRQGLDGCIVPRTDRYQGEYVAACDERLAWLTGFSGSAGFCVVLPHMAGVFIDGRYRTQVKSQVDLAHFTPVPWPEVKAGDWLTAEMKAGGRVGFDPWLHTAKEIAELEERLAGSGITLLPSDNMVDLVWVDRPLPPKAPAIIQPIEYAGESSQSKRARLGKAVGDAGQSAAVLTLPDSLSWLLNIRGSDIRCNPVVQAMGILSANGRLQLFIDRDKISSEVAAHLGSEVEVCPKADFLQALSALKGSIRVDRATAPYEVARRLGAAGAKVEWAADPCILAKAIKNEAEIAGMAEAHLRDGAAVVEFLAWLADAAPKGGLTEISVTRALEGFRRATNALKGISFETICGTGPNGAIMHYRVSEATDRPFREGEIVVIDSGGQYLDGTTDVTRTIAIGVPGREECDCFTRVLQGMIAISRLRWPVGLSGAHLDAIARYPLWLAHQDYNHGTGHGVGAYLSVHEGPAGLSRRNETPIEPGMILSNEPGYYREGAFGIRIENLILTERAAALQGGDPEREMLAFRTLTFVPIDRNLISTGLLTRAELEWINEYHAQVLHVIGPRLSDRARAWLQVACAPL